MKAEHHADTLDTANDLAQAYSDNGLHDVRLRLVPEQVQNEDGTWPVTACADCGEDLPQARLERGRIRCVACQELREQKQSLFRR